MDQIDTGISAPIDALPDDVLKLVFEEAYEHKAGVDEARDSVIIPTFVSHRWREVALSMPNLWACIHITSRTSIDIPKLYLSRAGSLLLYIHCASEHANTADGEKLMSPEIIQCLESFLVLYADRVRVLDINLGLFGALTIPEIIHAFHIISRHHLNNLCFLQIEPGIFYEYFVEHDICYSFFYPNLRFLHIPRIPINYHASSLDTLQELTISECPLSVTNLRALSKSAPQLLNLTLSNVELYDSDDSGDSMVCSFSRLQFLTLIDEKRTVDDTLIRIEAPALHSLCIQAYIDVYGWHARPPRPFPALRELHFYNAIRENDEKPYDGYLFACAPRTTLLTLHDTDPDSLPLVEYLIENPEALPELHTVEVTGPHKPGYLEPLWVLIAEQVQREGSLRRLVLSRAIYDHIGEDLEEVGQGRVEVTLADD